MMAKAQLLTKETCLWLVEQIESGFQDYHVLINPSSDIGVFVKEMRWLADNVETSPSKLTAEEIERWVYAFLRTQQAVNIAFTFQRLQGGTIPQEKFAIIQQKLDILNKRGTSQASDHFFELEIAGRLASLFPAKSISFAEPDIVLDTPEGKVGIACKCLHSETKLPRRIEEAANQGFGTGVPYFIVLDVSELLRLHFGAPAIHVDIRGDLVAESESFVSDMLTKQINPIKKAFGKEAGGVIISARCVGLVNKPALSWNWYTAFSQCPNFDIPHAGYALSLLKEILKS